MCCIWLRGRTLRICLIITMLSNLCPFSIIWSRFRASSWLTNPLGSTTSNCTRSPVMLCWWHPWGRWSMSRRYWTIVIISIFNSGSLTREWSWGLIREKDLAGRGRLVLGCRARSRWTSCRSTRYPSWKTWMCCWRSLWSTRRSGRRSRRFPICDSFLCWPPSII